MVGGSVLIWSVGRWISGLVFGGRWVDGRPAGCRWVGGRPVGESVIGGSVEELSVGRWSVVGGRWAVSG